jgi:RNA polymerase sigma-70 factor (ECF subfamily)
MLLSLILENRAKQVEQTEIIAAINMGDLNTFEMLFKNYYQPLVSYGRTFVHDIDEAEDIVQQTFITFWEKRKEIQIQSSVRAMLYTSVQNACLNRIKHLKVRQKHQENEIKNQQTSESPAHVLHAKELEKKISETIESLPPQCATIFKLSRYEGLKYQEIADQMQLSIKTVENQMGKALKILREQLVNYLPLFVLYLIQQL